MTHEGEHWLGTTGPKADVYEQHKGGSDVEKRGQKKILFN